MLLKVFEVHRGMRLFVRSFVVVCYKRFTQRLESLWIFASNRNSSFIVISDVRVTRLNRLTRSLLSARTYACCGNF